ncbi:MAG TPA: DUF4395 domain-containing protein [Microbacteriaceae bacterium]|nr:DUF4395 domain-containing protein [Microbacteriaceae bacterium]
MTVQAEKETPTVGQWVEGYEIPVINERAVRAAAGILLVIGGVAIAAAWKYSNPDLLKPFGIFFMFDMVIRLFLGDRLSPTMILGRFIVRKQTPEWVGASQKLWAWWLGYGMALTSCFAMGFFGAPFAVVMSLCSLCVTFLFLETAFGICVGCSLQRVFSKTKPQYCPGGVCGVPNHNHDVPNPNHDVPTHNH